MYTRRTTEAPKGVFYNTPRKPPSIGRSTGASSHSTFGLVETGPLSHSAFGLVEMGPLEWNAVDMGISAIAVDFW